MTKKLKFTLTLLAASGLPLLQATAQSIPAGVGTAPNIGFEVPQLSGSFNYALNAAELISTGYYGSGTYYSTSFSGDASYLSGNTRHPFSAIYSGGILVANSGQPNTVYQSLALSQSYSTKTWNFSVQDAVSYLPESPVSGLSGIPGVGDLGIDPTPIGSDAGIGILTNYGPRVSNTISGSVSRVISGHLSAQASGYDEEQRFIGDNSGLGLDNSGEGGSAGVSYHLDGRSAISGNFNYSRFSYSGLNYNFTTESGTVDYSRQWSRRLSTDVYAGPQYITNTNPLFGQPSTQIAAGGSATYNGRIAFYTLGYSRGANNGSGVTPGAFSDSVVGAVHRQFGRDWSVSGSLSYSRSRSLPGASLYNLAYDGVSASAQGVRRLGRRFSAYASYTLEEQTSAANSAGQNAFNGTYNIFGIGISYSPGSLFLSR